MIMKTVKLFIFMLGTGILFSCSKSNDASTETPIPTNVTYEKDVKAIMSSSCTRCHSETGTKQSPYLDTYQLVKDNSNLIIARIELPTGNAGVMPRGGKLPQATIDIIKAWKTQGLVN